MKDQMFHISTPYGAIEYARLSGNNCESFGYGKASAFDGRQMRAIVRAIHSNGISATVALVKE